MTTVYPDELKFERIAQKVTRKSQAAYFLPELPCERIISIAANP